MFAGRVPRWQRYPDKASHTADSHDAASASLCHVGQHLLGEWHRAQEVKVHQGLVNIHTGLYEQGTLAPSSIINQDVDLKEHVEETMGRKLWGEILFPSFVVVFFDKRRCLGNYKANRVATEATYRAVVPLRSLWFRYLCHWDYVGSNVYGILCLVYPIQVRQNYDVNAKSVLAYKCLEMYSTL